jgi:hypothetical protein
MILVVKLIISLFFTAELMAASAIIMKSSESSWPNNNFLIFFAENPIITSILILLGACGYIYCWISFIKRKGFFTLVGIVIPSFGVVFGWILYFAVRAEESAIKNLNTQELIDYIDRNCCFKNIGNNPWIAKNWNALSDDEKINWIEERRAYIDIHLPKVNSEPEFLIALQESDKNYKRKNN